MLGGLVNWAKASVFGQESIETPSRIINKPPAKRATKIGFYGPGNMGEYLIAHMTSQPHASPIEFSIYHPRANRCQELMMKYPVNSVSEEDIGKSDILFLCVKPSQIETVGKTLKPLLSPGCLVISIMAGITVKQLLFHLNPRYLARAMISIVSQNGRMFINIYTVPGDLIIILDTYFKLVVIFKEDDIDAIMSFLSCGPAFVAQLFKMYLESARVMLPNRENEVDRQNEIGEWVREMFGDTIQEMADETPDDLTARVACRGGATEKGLVKIDESTLRADLEGAFKLAYARAQEIGRVINAKE